MDTAPDTVGPTSISAPADAVGLPAALAGRYAVVRKLGRGAFGDVFLARDHILQRDICIKVLRDNPDAAASPAESRERMLREARAAARLKHPNIVTIHDIIADDRLAAIVMEHVEGENLRDMISRRGALPFDEAAGIARQVAEALAYAHANGVIHRDIKPANIFRAGDGTVKLGDFGTARLEGQSAITLTEGLVGTPAYMSPEQIQGQKVDGRTDVFSLGGTLYEMLTGVRPFHDPSAYTMLFKILHEEPAAPSRLVPTIPAAVDSIVARCLAKDREQRYPDAAALAAELGGVSAAVPTRFPPAARGLRRWRRFAAAAALVAILAGAAFLLLPGRMGARPFVTISPFDNRTNRQEFAFIAEGLSAELGRRFAEEVSVTLVPFDDVAAQQRRGRRIEDAARKAGAGFLITGALRASGEQLSVEYRLQNLRCDAQWQDTLPLARRNLQGSLNQIKGQISAWLDLKTPPRIDTMDPQAYEFYLRGVSKIVEMEQGRDTAFTEGRSFLERAVAIEPSVEVYTGLARLYYQAVNLGLALESENMDMARYYMGKALQIRPDYGPLIQQQLRSALQEGRYEDTLKIAAREIAADRLELDYAAMAAYALRQTGRYRWSGSLYRQTIRLFPENYYTKLNYAICLFQQGRHVEAMKRIRACVADEPDKYWGQFYLAYYSLLLGDTAAAARQAATLPDNATTQNILRQIALIRNNPAARDVKLSDPELSTTDVNHSLRLVETYALAGDTAAALRQFQINIRMGHGTWEFFDWDPLLARLRETPEYGKWREEGLRRRAAAWRRQDAIVRPIFQKLGIDPAVEPRQTERDLR
ncbi:MAG: protein kinase [Acidobacteria bacterium]|nr:protein kinase [Acidobacteriota bacterium]